MWGYLARRLAASVVLAFVVAASALLLTRLAPGDMTSELVGSGASSASIAAERERLGLDRSPLAQLASWSWRAVRLDFGTSMLYGRPVGALVAERAGNTAMLACVALAAATCVGIPLGVVAGSRRTVFAATIRAASTLLLSFPSLVSSLLLVFVAARTGWFPTGGMSSLDPAAAGGWTARALDLARHLVVPATALALPLAATLERLQSRAIADVLAEPYVAASRTRGIPPWRLLWRSALKPALQPVVAVYGLVLGSLLSGSFIVEIVAAWPGLGRLMFDALRSRDLDLVAGCAAAGGVFLALGALVSDLALAAIDPRVRGRAGTAS